MIAADVRIEGFDARSWTNLVSLFAPGVLQRIQRGPQQSDAPELDSRDASERPAGTLVAVISAERKVRRAFHTVRGRVRGLATISKDELHELAARYGARRALVIREGAIEEIAERVAQRLERGDDYIAQWLVLARTVRELIDAGIIEVSPRPFAALPIPTAGMVRRALDIVLPEDRSLVMVLWNGQTPWTAVALRRRGGEIDRIAGPDLIARWSGPLGGDWRRDHRFVSEGVERALAPLHLGIYGQIGSVRALLRSAEPGAWARAVALREVIVRPSPPYVAVALGADATRAIARRTATILGGIDALARFAPLASAVRSRVSEIASVTQTLGFDPLAVLAVLLARADAPRERDRDGESGQDRDEARR